MTLQTKIKNTHYIFIQRFAYALVFIALLYQPFWCLVNTHITSIGRVALAFTEIACILTIAILFLKGPFPLLSLILLILIFANTLILTIFQGHFEVKMLRNLSLPILLIWLGSHINDPQKLDQLVKQAAIVVIVIGLLEFIFPAIYSWLFNVVNYHIAIGRSTELAAKYVDSTFSLNGTRWGGRNLLPFLGDHRASSVFLETVNMGNFGVLLACWGLSKSKINSGIPFVFAALIIAVLADSRFASTLIALIVFLRLLVPVKAVQYIGYFSPLLILSLCFFLASPVATDDFKGRLGSTGFDILNFRMSEYFGLSNFHYSMFVDQGYAYFFHFSGLLLFLVLWISFSMLKMRSAEGELFKSFVAFLIAANLAISGDSVFAFKWVAILWILIGALSKENNVIFSNDKVLLKSKGHDTNIIKAST